MSTEKTLATGDASYTTGHCAHNNRPGGCQLHNLQCGYPACDRRPAKPSLATAKHGGCVQLPTSTSQGDANTIEKLRAMMDHSFGGPGFVVYGTVQSIAEVERRLAPTLSAQPSPGGQDALLASLVARWRNHAEEIGISDNLLCQKIANCTMRHAAELQAVLAARQPVGEPVTPWRDHSAAVDSKALATATEIALMWGKDRSQFVSRIQAAVIDAMQWMNGGLLEKPAQSVELGQFREAVQEAYENADAGTLNKFSLEELLALIDGKAVGK